MPIKISVIVPIYGVEKYLRQCVDSILSQTYRNLEVLLVDDGGRDACPKICDEYATGDVRVKVIHKTNAGYGAAVNTGMDASSGEWISIIEPDDWIESTMYERLVSEVADNVDIVKAGFTNYYPDGKSTVCLEVAAYSEALRGHPSIWTAIYRVDFLKKYNIRMREVPGAGWTDNPWLYHTFWYARNIQFVAQSVYNYRTSYVDPIIIKGDYSTPHDRMMEIFDWLESEHIKDEDFVAAVYSRCLMYVFVMTRMRDSNGHVKMATKELLSRMDSRFIDASNLLSAAEKMVYRQLNGCYSLRAFRNRHARSVLLKPLRIWDKLVWGV